MASFTAERRTKEIGVRKVLGASVFQIIKLLVIQASKPVFWANLIAWPVAWYAAAEWLSPFDYRIDLLAWFPVVIAFAAGITLAIGSATVLAHAVKISRANPIHALHHE